jgi:hypothetical protein
MIFKIVLQHFLSIKIAIKALDEKITNILKTFINFEEKLNGLNDELVNN